MRERSAVGGQYRKRNKQLSDVGISYMSRRSVIASDRIWPRKFLIRLDRMPVGKEFAYCLRETRRTRRDLTT